MRYDTKALPAAVLLVVAVRAKTSRGRFSSESEWTRIDKAHGQPFPPDPNARFGIACGDVQSCKYTCGVSARTVKLDGQPDITEPVTPIVCLKEAEQLMNSRIERYCGHEASGCLFLAGRQ